MGVTDGPRLSGPTLLAIERRLAQAGSGDTVMALPASYRLLEHTADAGVEATAPTPASAVCSSSL